MSLIHRLKRPRNLLAVLAAITVGSAAALGWLGWEMLRQEEAAEAQREQERLEHQAELAVQAFERTLNEAEVALRDFGASPPATAPEWSRGGLTVVLTTAAIVPTPPATLPFVAVVPSRPEPPAVIFATGEREELQNRNADRAADIYRRLAESGDPTTRAAALMRLARTLRNAGRLEGALTVYGELATLENVPVIGLPAELVGRDAEARLLHRLGRHDEATQRAKTLIADLDGGRWTLARGQYEHYADEAADLAGMPRRSADQLANAQAVADLWNSWRSALTSSGRRLILLDGVPRVVVWNGTTERLAGWVIAPDGLLDRLDSDSGLDVALSDGEGVLVAGRRSDARGVMRTARETQLPWAVQVGGSSPGTRASGVTRGRLVVAGLVVMLVFLGAGCVLHRPRGEARDGSGAPAVGLRLGRVARIPDAAGGDAPAVGAARRRSRAARERRQHYYESLAGESRRLQRLVENLLNFGRLEAGAPPYRPRAARSARARRSRSSPISDRNCRSPIAGSKSPADGDTGPLLRRSRCGGARAAQPLDNAVKYSGRGRTVRIDWARQGDRIALSVRDEGPGIPADEQRRIFQKFVRGTAAAARQRARHRRRPRDGPARRAAATAAKSSSRASPAPARRSRCCFRRRRPA